MVGPEGPAAATRVAKARAEMILNCMLVSSFLILNAQARDCLNEDNAKTLAIFILPDI